MVFSELSQKTGKRKKEASDAAEFGEPVPTAAEATGQTQF
jgi:hypothetical protein